MLLEMYNYEGESISNQPNIFPIEIHLCFFDVIAFQCDALRLTPVLVPGKNRPDVSLCVT